MFSSRLAIFGYNALPSSEKGFRCAGRKLAKPICFALLLLRQLMFQLFQTFLYAVIFREIELSLHALDNCRQGLARFFSIGGAEPNTSHRPICVNAGRGSRPLDNNADKSFATGARLFYGVRDSNLQLAARSRIPIQSICR
jgi:hypothetical protein